MYLGCALLDIINMKKAQALNIDGRTKVNKLKRDFQCLFNASLRVYDGAKLADEDDKLSVLRKEGCIGGEMVCTPNDSVERAMQRYSPSNQPCVQRCQCGTASIKCQR